MLPAVMTPLAVQPALPRHCTFEAGDWRILSRFWHPVTQVAEIGDQPMAVRLLDQDIVIYRTGAGLTAAADLCAHRGSPLSMGRMADGRIACAYHGYCYDGAGICVQIPAHPGAPIPGKLRLQVFRAEVRYGLLWVCLDPDSPETIPAFPQAEAAEYQVVHVPTLSWAAAAGRQVESFCDVAHFAFVHTSTFAAATPVVPKYKVEPREYGLHADFTSNVGNVSDPRAASQEWRRIYNVHLPFVAHLEIHFPGKGTMAILNAASPRSARQTRIFAIVARNFDRDQPVAELIAFQQRVYAEDQAIVERQNPEDLPIDLNEEVHVRADLTSVVYRQQLGRRGLGRRYTA